MVKVRDTWKKGKTIEEIFYSEYKERGKILNYTFESLKTGSEYKKYYNLKSRLTPDFVAININNRKINGAIEVKLMAFHRINTNDSIDNIRNRIGVILNNKDIRNKIEKAIQELTNYKREFNLEPFLIVIKIYNPRIKEPSFITMILDVMDQPSLFKRENTKINGETNVDKIRIR